MPCFEILTVILQFLTLIFLAIYVAKTWAIARSNKDMADATNQLIIESRESKQIEYAPYLTAYFEFNDVIVNFVIANIGKSPAQNVKVTVSPDLETIIDPDINHKRHLQVLKEKGFKQIAPGQKVSIFINLSYELLKVLHDSFGYSVTLTYSGGLADKRYEKEIDLDIEEELKRPETYKTKGEIKDIVKVLEDINRKLGR